MIKHKLADLVRKDLKIKGMYRGVVEDIEDPEVAGRVRCRIHGLHSQAGSPDYPELSITEIDGIRTDELPWCEPAISAIEFGAKDGEGDIGGIFGVPQVGSHVLIFFENENLMRPIYFAALPSMTEWQGITPTPSLDNFVFKVHGGHYIELDSTEGSERIKVYHISGTEIEVDSTGAITVTGQAGSDITLSGDLNITITGNCNISATGAINLN